MITRRIVLSCLTLATFLANVHRCRAQDEAPSFLKEPSSQVVKPHSRVRLKCEFSPKDATVLWTFNGQSLQNTSNDIEFRHNQIIINSFRSNGLNSHVGEYRCFVNTSIGLIVSRTAKLQKAYIKRFKLKPQPQTSTYLGGTAVIHCNPPKSEPEAIIQFEYNGQLIENTSERHVILKSSSLQIHNVTENDVGTYTCTGYNTILDERKRAESSTELIIKQDSGDSLNIVDVSGASVFIGENAVLGCVSEDYYVRWYRKEDQMPDKVEQKWGNLYIENVRKNDMGEYTCVSYSKNGTVTMEKNVHLQVKIRPAIRSPPKDTSVDPTMTLSLKCSVVGDEDDIRWLFNTVPIDPLDTDYIADGRQLKIKQLRVKHLGMYQCYVENELGSAQASAQVKFTRGYALPMFIEKPTNMTAIEHEQVFFVCRWHGQPFPFMQWWNPNNELVRNGRRFFIDGDPQSAGLEISNVQPQDAGWYTCSVKNLVGEIRARAYLSVIGMNVKIPTTQHTPLLPTRQPIEGAFSDEALTVTTNNVQQPIKKGAVPNSPSKAVVSQVTDSSVDITWTFEDDPNAPASEFYIQRLMVRSVGEWMNTSETIPLSAREYRIINLTPGTIYRFRVLAGNQFGSSEPGKTSNRFLVGNETPGPLPPAPPTITKCEAESGNSIIVEWKYKSDLENQPVDGFFIYHRADRDDDDEYEANMIYDTEINRHIIKHLENDMLYDIKMETYNAAGKSGFSNIMSVSTDSVNIGSSSTFMKPEYKPPVTPKSPVDIAPEVPYNNGSGTTGADKEEILYICIGVILGAFVIIFIMFAGMCIWRSRQPNGMFAAINWSQGYYGRSPPYSKGSQDINNRYMNGCPGYDQQYKGGPYSMKNGHLEPRPLYLMPQDTDLPIDVSQYLSAEENEINQTGLTLGSQHGTLERRHPTYVRPVKREDLRVTPNGVVCRPTYSCNGNIYHDSYSDISTIRDNRYNSNCNFCCQATNEEVNKYMTPKDSHDSLAHENKIKDDHTTVPTSNNSRQRRNSDDNTSNEDTAMSRSRSSSANSSQSTRSIVESDV
ncbi:cell adhesion molecule-related/down-regulated by oncogenes-like isoform X2 [Antedon mediterranea]|uniref:cell adhesion molecule-related/down-regulated by oncogenes-like isoform X2 n=1 Tax=Antedon mediterranea TaxID=105859 RepID=UPI003AF8A9B4